MSLLVLGILLLLSVMRSPAAAALTTPPAPLPAAGAYASVGGVMAGPLSRVSSCTAWKPARTWSDTAAAARTLLALVAAAEGAAHLPRRRRRCPVRMPASRRCTSPEWTGTRLPASVCTASILQKCIRVEGEHMGHAAGAQHSTARATCGTQRLLARCRLRWCHQLVGIL